MCSQPSWTGDAAATSFFEVSGRDLGPLDQHLAVLGDTHLGARQRGADRADVVGAGAVEGDQGSLGQAVGVVDLDPQLTKIQQHVLAGHSRADGQLS